MTPEEALQTAIKAAGGHQVFAEMCGISHQAVYKYTICPPHRVLQLEMASKGTITKYQLRPDIYGEDPS